MVNTRTYRNGDENAGQEVIKWISGSIVLAGTSTNSHQIVDANGANLVLGQGVKVGRVVVQPQLAQSTNLNVGLASSGGGNYVSFNNDMEGIDLSIPSGVFGVVNELIGANNRWLVVEEIVQGNAQAGATVRVRFEVLS